MLINISVVPTQAHGTKLLLLTAAVGGACNERVGVIMHLIHTQCTPTCPPTTPQPLTMLPLLPPVHCTWCAHGYDTALGVLNGGGAPTFAGRPSAPL